VGNSVNYRSTVFIQKKVEISTVEIDDFVNLLLSHQANVTREQLSLAQHDGVPPT
jgi:hypothetical protein